MANGLVIVSIARLWSSIDYRTIYIIKAAVAAAGAAILGWRLLTDRRRQTDAPHAPHAPHARVFDAALAVLAVLAFLGWWNFGRFHFPRYLHLHEQYHYYLGAKYFRELGYTRLYACTAVADLESESRTAVLGRRVRNLETNDLETGFDAVRDPMACTSHFTDDRWQAFAADVAWFRSRLSPQAWQTVLVDHGYNATPVWGMAGGLLAGVAPASDAQLLALGLLDPLLLLVMWAFVVWAFGWRAASVACLWWGTNYLAGYFWTGGAFLRADWLAAAVVGICLARRRHFFTAGVALAYASLLRIFPVVIAGGLLLQVLIRLVRTRSLALSRDETRFATGAIGAVLVLIPLSGAVVGGGPRQAVGVWSSFVANSQKHLNTPLANNIGLKTALSFEPASRASRIVAANGEAPWEEWSAARRRVFLEREWLYWLIAIAFVAAIGRAVDRQEAWVALVLGTLLMPILTDVTCYYYSVLLVLGFLWPKHGWTAVALCVVSVGSLAAAATLDFGDDTNLVASLLILACVAFAALEAGLTSSSTSPGVPSAS